MKREKMLGVRLARAVPSGTATLRIAFLLAIAALAVTGAQAQMTIKAIYDFSNTSGPLDPQLVGVFAQGRDGNMWSTAPKGGKNGIGAAFKITPGGKLTDVHDFDPSKGEGTSYSGLTLGTDGDFYGTMINGGSSTSCSGGCGAIFKMTPAGAVTILYSFTGGNDGKNPYAPPIQAANGTFWGNTYSGGISGYGTVYELTATGKFETTCVQFNGSPNGARPVGPLVQGTDGSFYGTTQNGVNVNYGTVFKVTSSCGFTLLATFGRGEEPTAGLVEGANGNFYGTAYGAGAHGVGYVFEVTPKGVLTDIYDFTGGSDGGHPYAGLTLATDGNFFVPLSAYGEGYGTVDEFTQSGAFVASAEFDATDGAYPSVPLIQLTNGSLYGDASEGGQTTNTGTFYEITGLTFEKTPFVSLLPTSGKVGSTAEILGQGFVKGKTTVSFNGTQATTVNVVSATFMTATVPTGATTGFVTVTTPTATLKSNRKFQVLK
jgi:uncharacterized repeat protein (TIGR03803 family)